MSGAQATTSAVLTLPILLVRADIAAYVKGCRVVSDVSQARSDMDRAAAHFAS